MAFDSPPAYMDGTTLDAEVFRRAIGTLLSPAGGIVTPGDLAVAQQTVPNMSVQIATGQVWVPGTSTATQGPYYSRNGAAITQAINASSGSNPRVDIVGVQVVDVAYAGAAKTCAPFYVAGTPTAGASVTPGAGGYHAGIGAIPASSLVLAYVLVPTSATSIVTADIENVAPRMSIIGQQDTGWLALTYGTGVVAKPLASPFTPGVRLLGDRVYYCGAVSGPTSGTTFFTTPAAIPNISAMVLGVPGFANNSSSLSLLNCSTTARTFSVGDTVASTGLILLDNLSHRMS